MWRTNINSILSHMLTIYHYLNILYERFRVKERNFTETFESEHLLVKTTICIYKLNNHNMRRHENRPPTVHSSHPNIYWKLPLPTRIHYTYSILSQKHQIEPRFSITSTYLRPCIFITIMPLINIPFANDDLSKQKNSITKPPSLAFSLLF